MSLLSKDGFNSANIPYLQSDLGPNIALSDFPNICRICLNKENIESLYTAKFENKEIIKMLQILDLEIKENDKGPQNICKNCIQLIYSSYNLHNYWKRSSQIINAILNENNCEKTIKTEILEPEITIKANNELEDVSKQEIAFLENCTLCNYETDNSINLKNHYNSLHSIKITDFKCRCLICKIDFNIEDIANHCNSNKHLNSTTKRNKSTKKVESKRGRKRKRKPINDNDFFCNICSEYFESFQDIFSHFESLHMDSQICIICNKTVKIHLKLHMQSHLPKKLKFYCRVCTLFFESQEKLDEHISTKDHVKKSQYICKYCDKQCPNSKSLNSHLRVHTSVGPSNICEICGQSFSYKTSLIGHKEVVHQGKRFYCSQCPKTFTTNGSLRVHIAKHHDPKPYIRKKYLCSKCPKVFSSNKSFNHHLASHISNHIPCQVLDCSEKFSNVEALNQHLRSTHVALNCSKCNKKYYNSDKFQSHLAFHEWEAVPDVIPDSLATGQDKPCKACGEKFENEDGFLQHVRNVHKVYLCHCKKAFVSYESLSSHMSKMHRSRKEIKCEICGKILYSNSTFKEHMDKHENIQRHSCNICNKSFTYKNCYQVHMRSHSQENPPTD